MNGRAVILGTVQFGLGYGVAGRDTPVPADEVVRILDQAQTAGVTHLDTAPVYGDIEARLASLIGPRSFQVISKIPAVPATGAVDAVRESVSRSRARLGNALSALLFHRAEDLLGPDGEALWRAAHEEGACRIGVSVYDPATLVLLRQRFAVSLAQLPANVFDQRLAAVDITSALAEVELHARSVFLQGLLLMAPARAAARIPAAASALARWHEWCGARAMTPLVAALAIARQLPHVSRCVVGVDHAAHLSEILSATTATPLAAPELACADLAVIDPRRWPAA